MRRRLPGLALLVTWALFLSAPLAAAAEDVLKLVPEGALGVVVVNRPAAVDAKLQELGRQMQLPVPSLLAMLKQQAGLREGLDEHGTVALIVLPPQSGSPNPAPILLLPVTDYGKFLEPFQPENETEGVSRITFLGAPGWARNIDGYAALTDGSHREVLEKVLKPSQEVPACLTPWRQWLAGNDVAGVVLRPGIKQISAKVQEGLRTFKEMMANADQPGSEAPPELAKAAEQAKMMGPIFDIYATMFQAAEKEVSACGLGLQLDEQSVLRLSGRTSLVSGGTWAQSLAQVHPASGNPLAGLPDEPFVMAGSGVVSDAMWQKMMKLSSSMMKTMHEIYGLSEEQIDKMIEISGQTMKGVRGMSMVLGVGHSGEPLYSTMVGVIRVDDSQAFLAGYEEYVRQYVELLKGAKTSLLPSMEIEKSEIDGRAALKLSMSVPQLPKNLQTPQYSRMMEAFYGPGGKIVGHLTSVDKHRLVMGYVDKDVLQRTIEAIRQDKPGLAGDASLMKTAALLPSQATAVLYVSPRGTIDFVRRIVPALAPPEGKADLKLPEFPKTVPLGLAVTTARDEVQMHLVVPAEVIRAVGGYVREVAHPAWEQNTPPASKTQ